MIADRLGLGLQLVSCPSWPMAPDFERLNRVFRSRVVHAVPVQEDSRQDKFEIE